MDYPVLSFSYLLPTQLNVLEEILDTTSLTQLNDLYDKYTLICHKDNQRHHNCPIHDIWERDITHPLTSNSIKRYYIKMREKYPPELISKLIIEDSLLIKRKVFEVINLAMDEIYQTDTMALQFSRSKVSGMYGNTSSIPTFLNTWAQEYFDVIDQRMMDDPVTIVIKKNKKKRWSK